MKVPVLIGAVLALFVGILAIGGVLASLSARDPTVPPVATPTVAPGEFGLYTPSPSPSPSPTPTPTPTPRPGTTLEIGTQVGQRAPALVLPDFGGGTLDSRAVTDRPLWVNFMATWCPPCREELPMMQGFALRLPDEIEIILVDVAEEPEEVIDFLVSLGVDLPVGLDLEAAAQREWGAFAMPVHFFIDEEGIVREVVFGGAPREIYVEAIRTVLPDVELDEEEE